MGVEHLIQYDCFLIGSALDLARLRMPDEQQITLAAEFPCFHFSYWGQALIHDFNYGSRSDVKASLDGASVA